MEGPIVEQGKKSATVQIHGTFTSAIGSNVIAEKQTEESTLESQVKYLRQVVKTNAEKYQTELQSLKNELANEKRFSTFMQDRFRKLKEKITVALGDEE